MSTDPDPDLDLPPCPATIRFELRVESRLDAPRDDVWQAATRLPDINRELAPWVRMSTPAAWRGKTLADLPVGEFIGTSWLLGLGVLPFDGHRLRVMRVLEGPVLWGFDESSTSWMQAEWHHLRRVVARVEGGCRVVDVVRVRPRLGLVTPVVRWAVTRIFRGRHRNLVERYGGERVS